jgi:hypothetical protein
MKKKATLAGIIAVLILTLALGSCSVVPQWPSEILGVWIQYWEASGDYEWYSFYDSGMTWYNSYYDDLGYDMPELYSIVSIDPKLKTFTVKSNLDGSNYDWTYSVSGTNLTLTAENGYSFSLSRYQ